MPIDLGEFSRKLLRQRTQLQLTEEEVTESTGIPAARVRELEQGASAPTGDEVLIFADFYHCDYRFFVSNERLTASEQTESLYRKYGDEFKKNDRRSVLEFLYLCECEQTLRTELGISTSRFEFTPRGAFYKGHAQQAAVALRNHFGYAPNAVPSDVYEDLRKIGFHVFRRRLTNSNISGVTIRHPYAGTCILVNYDEDLYRQRFTAAHEGAHGIIDRGEEVVVSFIGKHTSSSLIETRANTFASRYLLPPDLIASIPVRAWTPQEVLRWAAHFKVSTQALVIALKETGAVSEQESRQFARVRVPADEKTDPELGSLHGTAKNRKQFLLEKGLSTSYVRLCFEAYSRDLVSRARIAEMLLIDDFELIEIADLFSVALQTQ